MTIPAAFGSTEDLQAARRLIREHVYLEAKRLCAQWRDMSSPGTISYALHNAVLKQIELAATVGRIGE